MPPRFIRLEPRPESERDSTEAVVTWGAEELSPVAAVRRAVNRPGAHVSVSEAQRGSVPRILTDYTLERLTLVANKAINDGNTTLREQLGPKAEDSPQFVDPESQRQVVDDIGAGRVALVTGWQPDLDAAYTAVEQLNRGKQG